MVILLTSIHEPSSTTHARPAPRSVWLCKWESWAQLVMGVGFMVCTERCAGVDGASVKSRAPACASKALDRV